MDHETPLLCPILQAHRRAAADGAADWQTAQIADALRAAPPSMTHNAKLYAWQPYGQLMLVRDGTGPYTCVASGSSSLRFGQPPLPHPDPFCADPHAWAFIQAYWMPPDPDPLEPVIPLPHTPGLVWMLGVPPNGQATADSVMSRQLLILPLPIDPVAPRPGTDDPTHPLTLWMRARGTPIGYASVPVAATVHPTLLAMPPDPAR